MKKTLCVLLLMMFANFAMAMAETNGANGKLYIIVDGERYSSNRYTMYLPVDYAVELPAVVDEDGQRVTVTWKKVKSYGSQFFQLYSNGKIKATLQLKSCELIATDKKGRTFELDLEAHMLAKKIYCDPSSLSIVVGGDRSFMVRSSTGSMSGFVGDLTWTIDNEGIIRFEKASYSTGFNRVIGLKPGTATITAKQVNGAKATCKITVLAPERVPGDADDNGSVSINDAVLILRHAAGESVSINASNAEVNNDGVVNGMDALLLLQYAAGWDVVLQ